MQARNFCAIRDHQSEFTESRVPSTCTSWGHIVKHESIMAPVPELDVAGGFLTGTLINRLRLVNRRDMAYHALSQWRTPIKEHQLTALKLVKQFRPPTMLDQLTQQLADSSIKLFGSSFRSVTNVACGHGGSHCFARELAEGVAYKTAVPFVDVFAALPIKGSSHPRTNIRRPAMQVVNVPEGPVLLIDDVATSGSHICEAARLLRDRNCAVFPIAWIAP